uniref:Uncharacterized protein n=1 Tax=Navicula arenaria TaxID=355634 RepID=A0A976UFR4_9STRA|nr:hypothetical protein N4M20_pgp143 [Navicula arenaria]YP_010472102.1 hypothetical protein N4M20_pgp082 [Navicula arenaria]UVG41506.1 hypothetical protein [Navicula arenaria]UVG41567.1 hypothetical protein [Navicula arenaria]
MNQTRFLELLRKEEVLESENKSLYEVEKSEYSELTSYRIVLQEQIYYENRFQYIDLVKKCLDEEINCYEFQSDFVEIYQNDITALDKLIDKVSQYGIDSEMNFHTDSKIENFSSLLDDQLVPLCDFLADGLTEESFYHKLKFRLNLTIKQTLIIGNSIIPILTIKKKNKKKKTVVWRKIKVVMITY